MNSVQSKYHILIPLFNFSHHLRLVFINIDILSLTKTWFSMFLPFRLNELLETFLLSLFLAPSYPDQMIFFLSNIFVIFERKSQILLFNVNAIYLSSLRIILAHYSLASEATTAFLYRPERSLFLHFPWL